MLYHSFKLLSDAGLRLMVSELMQCSNWVDGATSATGSAKEVKRNIQLNEGSDTYINLNQKVRDLLMNDKTMINAYICPKKIVNILFSRTSVGMYYGKHVDAVHVDQSRRDYSFTLFLTNPREYEGGELILNIPPERKSIKLEAGSIVIYPTKYLHEVKEVTQGERMACVGWIESHIKNDNEREILGHIRSAIASIKINDESNSLLHLNIAYQSLKKHFGD